MNTYRVTVKRVSFVEVDLDAETETSAWDDLAMFEGEIVDEETTETATISVEVWLPELGDRWRLLKTKVGADDRIELWGPEGKVHDEIQFPDLSLDELRKQVIATFRRTGERTFAIV